jgi:hypothetical protein
MSELDRETMSSILYEIRGIKEHLAKINGKVQSHEKRLNEGEIEKAVAAVKTTYNLENRINTCPNRDRIESLERLLFSKSSIIKAFGTLLALVSLAVGIVLGTFKISGIIP